MIEFEVVIGENNVRGFFVFNWEEGVYEFLIEEEDGKRKVLFSGDIEYLKEILQKILAEIKRNEVLENEKKE